LKSNGANADLIEHSIEVTIIDDSEADKCDIGCGVDWSSSEAIGLASQRIKDRFGDRVKLQYLDVSSPEGNSSALRFASKIKASAVPILFVNGEPRISGPFDIRLLLDAIETELEVNGG